MARNIELLLLKSVENLGIVGDVVKVKPGFARNYLLPMGLAEPPHPARIDALKEDRAKAQAELSALRAVREQLVKQLQGGSVAIERSCNDQGALYGSVTQRDISDALVEAGFGVDVRSIRLSHPIRRIGVYTVPIHFEKDLGTEVSLTVKADHELEGYSETGEQIETPDKDEAGGERRAHHEDRPRRPRQFGDYDEFDDDDDRPRGRKDKGKGKGKGRRGRSTSARS